ncbi:MAG: hypothetical protein M1830_004352 [Pleopsidium flavum]|nr:MAG: hypothetical protein M1830_004352 [Pleopsidium flavum]
MASKKLLVVFGATGGQGGSVVKSILGDPKTAAQFAVRAVTRDASKPNAQDLAAKGAEVVTANLDDKSSLRSALKGAYAVFAVTNYWEKMSAEVEVQQGKNVADVAKELSVEHFIWSSLLNIKKLSGGKFDKVYHFDAKANVEEYIRSIGMPATFFLAGFFMSNIPGKAFRPDPETNAYTLALPIPTTSPIPLFDAEDDTGKVVKGILLNREKTLGKRIFGAEAYYTPGQVVEEFKVLKPESSKGAKAVQIPHEVFRESLAQIGAPEIIQEEMVQAMLFMPEFGYYGNESLDESHSILSEPLTTWKEYMGKSQAFAKLN